MYKDNNDKDSVLGFELDSVIRGSFVQIFNRRIKSGQGFLRLDFLDRCQMPMHTGAVSPFHNWCFWVGTIHGDVRDGTSVVVRKTNRVRRRPWDHGPILSGVTIGFAPDTGLVN